MVLDRTQYGDAIKEIIIDQAKLKELVQDVTIKGKAKL